MSAHYLKLMKSGNEREREEGVQKMLEAYIFLVKILANKFKLPWDTVWDFYVDAILKIKSLYIADEFEIKNEHSCKAYIRRFCELKCLNANRLKSNQYHADIDSASDISGSDSSDKLLLNEDLLSCFKELGAKCQEILRLDFDGYSINEIQQIMNYGTLNSVSATKTRCMKKLRECLAKRGYP